MSTEYYLGLDIGTDSVGYAVTDVNYRLLKKKGEPLWGVTTFEAANTSADRRAHRTARRRLDRRQQRVALLNEIFACEIAQKDPRFFLRLEESRLYRTEADSEYSLFDDADYNDRDYHRQYPTIHHLIFELMSDPAPHDVRLVYLACSWLLTHRGHFLFDVSPDNIAGILDFGTVYSAFCDYLAENGSALPWPEDTSADTIRDILCAKTGVKRKQERFKTEVYGGKKPPKEKSDTVLYSPDAIVNLLCGSKVKPELVFLNGEYGECESVSLGMAEEDFARVVAELGDDGELLIRLRAMTDCALLLNTAAGKSCISEAKIDVYNRHRADLRQLKAFVRKYIPCEYNAIFREPSADNYVAYSYNIKGVDDKNKLKNLKKTGPEDFCKFLKNKLKDVEPDASDRAFYEDMMARLDLSTFLQKQKTTENRIIPQQLYRYELSTLLDRAETYLPMLSAVDSDGMSKKEKILSIFDFKIPYYVGPLNPAGSHAWIVKKGKGKIYPWNFKDIVDLDASEQRFIERMTNSCTYLAGESVLPVKSLLYCRYTVLNEINNLKINENPIPVEAKQRIFTELFMRYRRVTPRQIETFLRSEGLLFPEDKLSGIDTKINSALHSYHIFKNLLESGVLTEAETERIIGRSAYSEDKGRFLRYLAAEFPQLSEADRKYIARQNLKEFGRLSLKLLSGIHGAEKDGDGEALTIIEALWSTNLNLMQLLSDRYSFKEVIADMNREYYAEHPATLSKRLEEMYISNSVKRPIFRTLDICSDVVRAMGCAPKKIFVEMARDASGENKGKRTQSRKQQLLDLMKQVKTDDARRLERELEAMGELADNRLQGDKLFLYYMQLGRCAYTGKAIDLSHISDSTYDIDHIYPRSLIKDDSVLNNKVLVFSEANASKSDNYPVPVEFRNTMRPIWESWHSHGLINAEKLRRLTRASRFTEEEKWGFINRQLVETRQSTKAVAALLTERFGEGTELVYVKAGLVSEFRQTFNLLKSRSVNILHHAKDAYLNIVVGNVYSSRFNKRFFDISSRYSVKPEVLFTRPVNCGSVAVWQGTADLARVKETMGKNAVHITRYPFCRKGGLFDQMPLKAAEGLVPLKSGMDPAVYGGYNKPTASFFSLVRYTTENKTDIMTMPVDLVVADRYLADESFAEEYAGEAIQSIIEKPVLSAELLKDRRIIKVNTMLSLDGVKVFISSKDSRGKRLMVSLANPLVLEAEDELYIKAIESFLDKRARNKALLPDARHDGITAEKNTALYDKLAEKMGNKLYSKCPGNQYKVLSDGRDKFISLDKVTQVQQLSSIIRWFNPIAGGIDISSIGGKKQSGVKLIPSFISSLGMKYSHVEIIDSSASGIYESRSGNLLSLL